MKPSTITINRSFSALVAGFGLCAALQAQAPRTEIEQIAANYGTDWIDRVASKKKAAPRRWTGKGLGQKLDGNWDLIPGMKDRLLSDKAMPLPLWLPMCFLFDSTVNLEAANKKLRTMTAAYASCGIALVPMPFSIAANLTLDSETMTRMAKEACPIPMVFGVRGAVQVEAGSEKLAQQMCKNPNANGCSTLCSPLSVSLVAPNSGPEVGLHESMHSNCCGPLCVDQGQGTGLQAGGNLELASLSTSEYFSKPTFANSKLNGTISGPAISELGCDALRAGSAPNDFTHWYDPERKIYYEPNLAEFKRGLAMGQSFFSPEFIASLKNKTKATSTAPEKVASLGEQRLVRSATQSASTAARPDTAGSPLDMLLPEPPARAITTRREFNLGFTPEAEAEKLVEHKKGIAPRKGWERRPASEEIRIFEGFESSTLNKTSVEHFAE